MYTKSSIYGYEKGTPLTNDLIKLKLNIIADIFRFYFGYICSMI